MSEAFFEAPEEEKNLRRNPQSLIHVNGVASVIKLTLKISHMLEKARRFLL